MKLPQLLTHYLLGIQVLVGPTGLTSPRSLGDLVPVLSEVFTCSLLSHIPLMAISSLYSPM